MQWLKDLPIGRKLAAAFAILTLLAVLLGLHALKQMGAQGDLVRDITGRVMPSQHRLLELRGILGEYRTFEVAQLGYQGQAAELADYRQRLAGLKTDFDNAISACSGLLNADTERELLAVTQRAAADYFGVGTRIATAIDADDFNEARRLSGDEARPLRRALMDHIKAQLAEVDRLQKEQVAHADASARRSMAQLWSELALVAVLAAVFGWTITRSVTGSLRLATRVAEGIAQGQLNHRISVDRADEGGRLLRAMNTMQTQLTSLRAAQQTLAEQHAAGVISYRIDAVQFPGDFGQMAAEVNGVVAAHVQAQQRMADVMTAYAKGDFSADMPRLPGEQAALSNAMDTVKQQLGHISKAIRSLAEAAQRGDFSARGEEAQFQFEFRAMVSGLNSLMQVMQKQMAELAGFLGKLADGDLSCTLQVESTGVFASLRAAAESMTTQWQTVIGKILESSSSVKHAAGEIAAGNFDLSARTEQQAASLEETAASMEELTATVRQNAENARTANQLAQGAADVASSGSQVVNRVVATMGEIDVASRRIVDIISVIDGIAFQTNILALNAAVEAARAGDQGRGFAVVAAEVRSLAQRSASAAKEISGLINDSVDKVRTGTALVDEAGKTMNEIQHSVRRVTDIMGEISAASSEQSSGIEQVGRTVADMDQATQQNAALVEEASAAARQLEEQAAALAAEVAHFRL